jgi:hypothetical protein
VLGGCSVRNATAVAGVGFPREARSLTSRGPGHCSAILPVGPGPQRGPHAQPAAHRHGSAPVQRGRTRLAAMMAGAAFQISSGYELPALAT